MNKEKPVKSQKDDTIKIPNKGRETLLEIRRIVQQKQK